MAFVVEGGAADETVGPDGAVSLFLLQHRMETVDAGDAVYAEGAQVVADGVSIEKDEDGGWGVESSESSVRTMVSMSGVTMKFAPCFRRVVMRRIPLAMLGRNVG